MFEQNVSRLGIDLGPVEAMVLSHGHWDHAGAMLRALQLVLDRNGGKRVPCYMHPDMFRSRAVKMPDGSFRPMEDVPSLADARRRRRPRRLNARAAAASRTTACSSAARYRAARGFETGMPGQHRRTAGRQGLGARRAADRRTLRRRERARQGPGRADRLQPCRRGQRADARAGLLPRREAALRAGRPAPRGHQRAHHPADGRGAAGFDLDVVAAGHCTGWRAMAALTNAFGDKKLTPLAVGKRLSF